MYEFLPQNLHVARRFDTDPHAPSCHTYHRHHNSITDQ
jgi:hypothetical protein